MPRSSACVRWLARKAWARSSTSSAHRTPRSRPTGRGVTRPISRSWPPVTPSRLPRLFVTSGGASVSVVSRPERSACWRRPATFWSARSLWRRRAPRTRPRFSSTRSSPKPDRTLHPISLHQDRDVTAQLNARGDVAVLVPAAGAGLRLGPGGPKALRLLAGEPLLVHAIRRVAAAASVRQIVVAAPAAEIAAVRSLLAPIAPVTVVAGGAERQESVALALAQVPAEIDIVLVHDAARALTPPALIEAVAAAVRGGAPAVIPVLPVVDTIKEVAPGGARP